ncbi:PASTA domain-containing protein [Streptomyces coeruleoprunus]|uniref:PASTA domain-containing protein n=1 Tax=Streptomyces coeruleoprunus TaxID=285563 RepID=A0ABV9XJR1_9ACTN
MAAPRTTPEPSPPRRDRAWWRTPSGRLVCVAAVPLLGLVDTRLGAVALIVALVVLWRGSPWPKAGKVAATMGTMALLGAVVPDPREDRDTATAAHRTRPPVTASSAAPPASPSPRPARDYRGERLDVAYGRATKSGFTVVYHDASDERKDITARSLWTVCFQQRSDTGERPTLDFGAVRTGDPCPKRDGGPVPWPTMPELVWKTWPKARAEVVALGVPADRVRAEAAYVNDTLPDEGAYDDWRVCAHDPAAGEKVPADTWVTLELSSPENGCPDPDRGTGTSTRLPDRDKDGDPDYRDPFPRDRNRTKAFPNGLPDAPDTGGSGGGGGWSPCRHTRWC